MSAGKPKGLPKSGGRVKGVGNKKNSERTTKIIASGLSPLEYLLSVMRDEAEDAAMRLDAGKAAAPYIHPKLSSVELSGDPNRPVHQKVEIAIIDPKT